jgi:hypothetical protein
MSEQNDMTEIMTTMIKSVDKETKSLLSFVRKLLLIVITLFLLEMEQDLKLVKTRLILLNF